MTPTKFHLSQATLSRRALIAGLASLTTLPGAAQANSGLGLIMVDDPNCVYCRKWDAEVGRSYSRTPQGRFAPLVRVRRKSRELANLNPVIYTPTFILVRRGEELSRMTGYPGAEAFYSELDRLLSAAGFTPSLPGVAPIGQTRT